MRLYGTYMAGLLLLLKVKNLEEEEAGEQEALLSPKVGSLNS